MSEGPGIKHLADLDFDIDKALKDLDSLTDKLNTLSEKSEKTFKNMQQNAEKSVNATTNSWKSLQNVDLTKMSKGAQTEFIKGSAKIEYAAQKTSNKLKEIEAKTQKALTDQVKSGTSSRIAEYAKTFVIYQGFNQLKQAATDTVEAMKSVEYRMMEISRIMAEGSINVNQYRDDLINLAYEYGRSFEDVSTVTLNLARAGYDAKDSLALTEKALLALNTAELDASQATDGLISIMAQWGMDTGTTAEKADNFAAIIDKINKTADNFPITSEGLLEALKRTSQGFNLAGASIDETIAMIVAAERAAQRGGKVIGTAMANITQQLKAEGKLNLAEDLGLDFYEDEAKTKFKSITDIFATMSERMQQLKEDGKESSTEMQSLLELFTVFRRNIGAGLLSEMSGEDSTYAKALANSIDSIGYSAQENSKYMNTATAATEQFHATLLKLQTTIWDNQGEGFFYSIINGGKNLIEIITNLIDKIGLLPVAIGTVTLAYTALKSKVQLKDVLNVGNSIKNLNAAIDLYNDTVVKGGMSTKEFTETLGKDLPKSTVKAMNGLNGSKASILSLSKSFVAATAKQALLTVGTVALNAALTAGISVITTLIATGLDNLINAEEKVIEKNQELKKDAEEKAEKYSEETKSLQELANEYKNTVEEYNKLKENKSDTSQSEMKLLELQENLNSKLKESGKSVDIIKEGTDEYGKKVTEVNQKYEEQLNLIKSIAYENKKNEVEELKKAMKSAEDLMTGTRMREGFLDSVFTIDATRLQNDLDEVGFNIDEFMRNLSGNTYDFAENFENLSFEQQFDALKKWKTALEEGEKSGKDVSKSLEYVNSKLSEMESQINVTEEAIQKYKEGLSELYAMSGQIDNFNTFLDAIAGSYNIEGPTKLIEDLKGINQEFSDGQINVTEYFDKIQEKISEIDFSAEGEELEAYQAIFAATSASIAEGLESIIAGYNSQEIDFSDYAEGIKEAADNTLDLYTKSNNLQEIDGVWQDAAGNVDEYANSLANARDELGTFGDSLKVIGDNYDYISEHANLAGEAAFKQSDVATEAYQNLATNFGNSLQQMKSTNEEAYNAITAKVFEAMGTSANEVTNADAYITEALNGNSQALNAALNEAANQVSISTSKVTVSMGNVLSKLGEAISGFTYNINAKPYIRGKFELSKDEKGVPNGISLPSFGFDITGEGGESVTGLGDALKTFGGDLGNLGKSQFKYTSIKSNIKPYTPSSSSPTSGGTGSGGGSKGSSAGGGRGGSGSSRDTAAKEAEKAAEEARKKAVSLFEEIIDERERLEDRWVKNKKKLGLISDEDEKYILQQSIKRYRTYVDEVNQLTMASEEEKTRLRKKYGEIAEDLEVEYFELLKDILEDQIDAIEDKYKEDVDAYKDAIDEKIDKIKEQADAEIEALEKVEDENDRIRQKEEYEANRRELMHGYQGVEYWQQRTGREAQLALAEAKKKVEDLDKNWEETVNKWNVEDQIKLIEERRDADIEATEAERDAYLAALEDTKNAEIQALRDKYQYQLDYFNQTGQIIQDNATIQAQNLFDTYKRNFIDPVGEELRRALDAQAQAPTAPAQASTVTYTIQYGDTLTGIARKYGTTIEKIMAANPYVTNRNLIYAGRQLRIPTSHTGSKILKDGLVELQAGETVLNMEWARGLDKMLGQFNRQETNTNNFNNGSTINIDGSLVNVEANIEDKADITFLTKKITRELSNKFNISK